MAPGSDNAVGAGLAARGLPWRRETGNASAQARPTRIPGPYATGGEAVPPGKVAVSFCRRPLVLPPAGGEPADLREGRIDDPGQRLDHMILGPALLPQGVLDDRGLRGDPGRTDAQG